MNGGQDLGGVHGFGPVEPEQNEPVFHADWEKRAFALTLAMGTPGGSRTPPWTCPPTTRATCSRCGR